MLPEPDLSNSLILDFKIEIVEQFWLNQVKDVIVEKVVDDDVELIEL